MAVSQAFYDEFGSAFWLTLAGAIFGFGGVCINAILKSRCKELSCCCMKCVRDVAPPGQEPQVELDSIKITNPPPTKTISRNNSI